MRIAIAGAFAYDIYEPAAAQALRELGHEVIAVSSQPFLGTWWNGLERRGLFQGRGVRDYNASIVECARSTGPDALVVWSGVFVHRQTIDAARRLGIRSIVSYNNDNPFAQAKRGWRAGRYWRNYFDCLSACDANLVYRPANIRDAQEFGSRRTAVMMPGFIPSRDFPVRLDDTDRARWSADAVYVGHFEDDGRLAHINALANAGMRVRVYGPPTTWTGKVRRRLSENVVLETRRLDPSEYRKAVAGAKLGLCFLSAFNQDVYTRRCFEIPAMGGVLVSERTTELATILDDGTEAIYFDTPDELVARARGLIDNPARLSDIRSAGLSRIVAGRHSIGDRMRVLVDLLLDVASSN